MTDEVERLIDSRLLKYKKEIDVDVQGVRDEMRELRTLVDDLGADFHRTSLTVSDMNTTLQDIAASMKKLADLPDTWDKIKGFWAVASWLRSNLLPATTLLVLLLYVASTSDVLSVIKGLLP